MCAGIHLSFVRNLKREKIITINRLKSKMWKKISWNYQYHHQEKNNNLYKDKKISFIDVILDII